MSCQEKIKYAKNYNREDIPITNKGYTLHVTKSKRPYFWYIYSHRDFPTV